MLAPITLHELPKTITYVSLETGLPWIAGNKAPKFSYKNSDGNKDSLDNYLGSKVLLCFYPKDNTPGCTSEACSLSESIVKFDEQKVKVFGISKDNEVSHQKFVSKYNLKITLIPCLLYTSDAADE